MRSYHQYTFLNRNKSRNFVVMESVKQQKFARLMQRELSEIFQQESANLFGGTFVSVTIVRASPDLRSVKVYLSFMLSKDPNAVLQSVKDQQWEIKKLISKRIRNKVQFIPEFFYYLDDSIDEASRIDNIFKDLDIPPAEEGEQE